MVFHSASSCLRICLPSAAFLAPFAGQQFLRLEPAQQGVERAFVDVEAEVRQRRAHSKP